ncbi:MAG TPA: phage holin family protein [Baekduia sp.]|nr:phage holin family protein [Baekduia sp.]
MSDQNANIAQAIQEVSEKAQLLVREEIELAKAEVTQKITRLVRGLAIGAAAGLFVIGALIVGLHGFAWLAYWAIPFPDQAFFWGFFVVAAVLLLLGGLAGFLAAKAIKAGSNPAPQMAIEEAKLIRETVTSSEPQSTVQRTEAR